MADHNWLESAACASHDPDKWFPAGETGISPANVEALLICQRCPVRMSCLETALREKLEYGIWGGTFGNQRRRMQTKLQIKKRDGGWVIDQLDQRAIAATWETALKFANQLLKKEVA